MSFDAPELCAPVLSEHAAPVVNRTQCLSVGPIEHAPAVAPDRPEVYVEKHLQMLRYGRLFELERIGNLAHRTLVGGNELENPSAARFGYGVEGIGDGRCTRHALSYIFLYGNMSSRAVLG